MQLPCDEGGSCGECLAPIHAPCDDTADITNALGMGCPGEHEITLESWGSSQAFGTLQRLGNTSAFAPTEGQRYVVIGSGRVEDLPKAIGTGTFGDECSSDLGAFDPGMALPDPIRPTDVGMEDCTGDPGLIGNGDCSNSIQEQFEASFGSFTPGASDYTEIRFTTTVPEGASSFSYDLAFLTFEYPDFYASQYNDMYIGWVESDAWTGNVSFDESGAPISVNASFMDYLDADTFNDPSRPPHPQCPEGAGCGAPELHGTCMEGHGATRWLTSTASVTPGEEITVVFAVMDLGDSSLDSYVLLDNFGWGCDGGVPPVTVPID
jgi:hypothetical protein